MKPKIVQYDFDPVNPPAPTDAQKSKIEALSNMRDDDIDFSDIPLITDWTGAERGKFYRPVRQQLTLRLDADVVHWFKSNVKDGGYQTRINEALRRYVDGEIRMAG